MTSVPETKPAEGTSAVKRLVGHAPQVASVADTLSQMKGPCIGCPRCQGLCQALIDVVVVPKVILSKA